MKSRVIDVVTENGYDVGDRDDLYPAGDQPVHQSDTIVLRRSRPLQISLDGQNSREVWTTASTVDEALAQLSMTDKAPAAASRGSRVPLGGMSLPVVSAKNVQINDGGAVQDRASGRPERRRSAGRRRRSAGAERHGGARRPRRLSSRECRSRSRVSGSRRSPSAYRLPPNNKRVEDPTMNMSRQVVENPGTPGVQDVTFAIAKVNGVGDRQTASSQCHHYSGHRRGAAGGHQAWYGSASCEQWRHLGCARLDVRRAATGRSIPATVFSAACNLIKTPGSGTAV